MLVYRVAHEELTYDGFPSGPYVSAGLTYEVREALSKMDETHSWNEIDTHPTPRRDSRIGYIADCERCGFDSLDALYEWFKGYTHNLQDNGFLIYVYEVDEGAYRVGEFGQAVFDTAWAKQIQTMDFHPTTNAGKAA